MSTDINRTKKNVINENDKFLHVFNKKFNFIISKPYTKETQESSYIQTNKFKPLPVELVYWINLLLPEILRKYLILDIYDVENPSKYELTVNIQGYTNEENVNIHTLRYKSVLHFRFYTNLGILFKTVTINMNYDEGGMPNGIVSYNGRIIIDDELNIINFYNHNLNIDHGEIISSVDEKENIYHNYGRVDYDKNNSIISLYSKSDDEETLIKFIRKKGENVIYNIKSILRNGKMRDEILEFNQEGIDIVNFFEQYLLGKF